jgi:hypothetical protein
MKRFDRKPPSPAISREEALRCRPWKSTEVTEEHLQSGDVVLSYPVVMRPWFARLLHRMGGPEETVRIKKLQLDALGTAVWELMDGRRTVRQVIEDFAGEHQLHPREAEVSVTLFLRDLGRRGIVGLD